MFPLPILPVLDLQGGWVVRGVAGRRSEYRPLVTRLGCEPTPAAVAAALHERFGFAAAYVADLDALAGAAPAVDQYEAIAAWLPELWIDAGLRDADDRRSERLAAWGAARRPAPCWIAALESVVDEAALAQLAERFGPALAFSLDLRGGRLAAAPAWRLSNPLDAAAAAVGAGIRRLIVLDVAAVGQYDGVPTLDLCRAIRHRWPQVEIVSGGGVRQRADLAALADAGCSAALVASALHDGRLEPA